MVTLCFHALISVRDMAVNKAVTYFMELTVLGNK